MFPVCPVVSSVTLWNILSFTVFSHKIRADRSYMEACSISICGGRVCKFLLGPEGITDRVTLMLYVKRGWAVLLVLLLYLTQVWWIPHSWLLTVWPIPSTCMVALCTRSKPWPVTVIVLPPLWQHARKHTENQIQSHDKRMSNALWYANSVGHCGKTTEKQASHMSSKTNTRNLPHTFCVVEKTIVRKRCTSGGHYCEGFCQRR